MRGATAVLGIVALWGAACGGGDGVARDGGMTTLPAGTLQGVAAVGAPITGGTVTVACGGGTMRTASTNAQGAFGVDVPMAAYPCALRVTGGAGTYHSFAAGPGLANITPLTDAVLAVALKANPATAWALWAGGTPPLSAAELTAGVQAAEAAVKNALTAAGYTVPAGSFFTSAFTAAPGQPYDDLLEAVGDALAAAGKTHADLIAQLVMSPTAPNFPARVAAPATKDAGATDASTTDGPAPVTGGADAAPQTTPDAAPPTNSSPLPALGGAVGTFRGMNHLYDGDIGWGTLTGTGTFTAYKKTGDSVDPLSRWQIRGLPLTAGTYSCEAGKAVHISLSVGGVPYTTDPAGTSCTIVVKTVSTNTVEGTFTATLSDANGMTFPVTDGHFRKAHPDTTTVALGPNETGGTMVVNGMLLRYPRSNSMPYDTYTGVVLSSNTGAFIQIHTVPNMPGTYNCGDGPSYRNVNVWFFWQNKFHNAGARASATPNGPPGSSCTITLTKVGTVEGTTHKGTIEGTFSGTFVTGDGASKVVVTDGKFRHVDP